MLSAWTILILSTFTWASQPSSITTNALEISRPPAWLKRTKVEKVTDRIQSKLEWTIRKTKVFWYHDQQEFQKQHSLGPMAAAVTVSNSKSQKILIGPKVTQENFEEVFSHELVHLIFAQKYRSSIPKWLEEGFANHLSRKKKVDYIWLKKQTLPDDVQTITHPLKKSPQEALIAYSVSQALVEMLDKKCDLENLIRLSVQRDMTDYIRTFCEIPDLNQSFKKWLQDQPLV